MSMSSGEDDSLFASRDLTQSECLSEFFSFVSASIMLDHDVLCCDDGGEEKREGRKEEI